MSDSTAAPNARAEWRVIAETVAGASHRRAGIPNQDAVLQQRATSRALPLLVSLSDGHGSHKCFRSDRGSRFAVRAAARIVGAFLDARRGASDTVELERAAAAELPAPFVAAWRAAVEADLAHEPFTAAEFDRLVEKDGLPARQRVEANPWLAYGATSVTVAVEAAFLLCLQLGDGDIFTVSAAGEVARALPDDERLFANETTSLCLADAASNFRVRAQSLAADPPALILLSTDGYVNSFADEAGFLKVGSDLLEMLRGDGFNFVNEQLGGWLEEATQQGSGDDTTVAIICRMNALTQAATAPVAADNKVAASVVTPTAQSLSTPSAPPVFAPPTSANTTEEPTA